MQIRIRCSSAASACVVLVVRCCRGKHMPAGISRMGCRRLHVSQQKPYTLGTFRMHTVQVLERVSQQSDCQTRSTAQLHNNRANPE